MSIRQFGPLGTLMAHKLTTELPYLDELLKQSESGDPDKAIERFNNLCERGCDRETLGRLLVDLANYWRTEEPFELASGRIVYAYPLDSKAALDPQDGARAISLRGLRDIWAKAEILISQIERLRRTPLVHQLKLHGIIQPGDLLSGRSSNRVFHGLRHLPQLAKTLSPKARPEYSKILTKIYEHIRERTQGHFYDELLVEILHTLKPGDSSPTPSAEALKEWRRREGVINRRKPRERRKSR